MTGQQIYTAGWIAASLMIGGLVLCFSSPSLGAKKAGYWLQSQEGGMADTSLYTAVTENNMTMFAALGSILFAAGLLAALGIYFLYLILGTKESPVLIENLDIQP
jgi:hypothetical protein